jgi:DNA repair exonuclease SbcCD ATPase subunit
MSSENEKIQQSILAIIAQQNKKIEELEEKNQHLTQDVVNLKRDNQQQSKKIEELEEKNEDQEKKITALEEKAEDLQNLRFGDSERFLMLEQNKRHAEKEIEKLKEEIQQLKEKGEEQKLRMEIVEVLRKEAEIEIPEEAGDAAVQKILGECKFPLLTEKIDLSQRYNITDISTGRIVAACPNVTEMNLSFCRLLDVSLQHLASLRNLKSLNLAYCRQLSDELVLKEEIKILSCFSAFYNYIAELF